MIGIPNIGNICFISSIIQILYYIPEFRSYVISKDFKINNEDYVDFFSKLQNIFIKLNEEEDITESIVEFCNSLKELNKVDVMVENFTNFNIHNDSSEFLIYIFDKLDDYSVMDYKIESNSKADKIYFDSIKNKNIINKLFKIQQLKQIKCMNCSYLYPLNFNNYLEIWQLNISQYFINNLFDAIKFDSMTKNMDDYNCEKCKTISQVKERTILSKLNDIFIIQLLRFNNDGSKINKDIIIPFQLNLDKFSFQLKNKNYKLSSVCCHISNNQLFGHYFSIVNLNNKWIIFDDNNVKEITNNDAKSIINRNGYLLIYHKI